MFFIYLHVDHTEVVLVDLNAPEDLLLIYYQLVHEYDTFFEICYTGITNTVIFISALTMPTDYAYVYWFVLKTLKLQMRFYNDQCYYFLCQK